MTESERYAQAWRSLKRQQNVTFFVVLLYAALMIFGIAHGGIFQSLDMLWFLAFVIFGWITPAFRCPRCGSKFHDPVIPAMPGRCCICKLPKWADYDSKRDAGFEIPE
jgi:hypothetical protein